VLSKIKKLFFYWLAVIPVLGLPSCKNAKRHKKLFTTASSFFGHKLFPGNLDPTAVPGNTLHMLDNIRFSPYDAILAIHIRILKRYRC
jgi:hypothetical protein